MNNTQHEYRNSRATSALCLVSIVLVLLSGNFAPESNSGLRGNLSFDARLKVLHYKVATSANPETPLSTHHPMLVFNDCQETADGENHHPRSRKAAGGLPIHPTEGQRCKAPPAIPDVYPSLYTLFEVYRT